jgi:hypothetical protein
MQPPVATPSPTRAVRPFPLAASLTFALGGVTAVHAHPQDPNDFDPRAHLILAFDAPQALLPATEATRRLQQVVAQDAVDLAAAPNVPTTGMSAARTDEAPTDATRLPRLDRVLVDATAEAGVIHARGPEWKARFDAEGMEYHPRLGRSLASQPTSFHLAEVTRGGQRLVFGAAEVSATASRVTLDRGALREVYHLGVDSLEQTFEFDVLPGAGELVLDIAVESTWEAIASEELLRFVAPGIGEVTYGRAYVYDASGAGLEIARTWDGDSIQLTVPAAFLAEAVLPLTVDPIVASQVYVTASGEDDTRPDTAFSVASYSFWVVWEEHFSATDMDVFARHLLPDGQGTTGATFSVDITTDYWETPAIAAAPAADNLLVVASTTPDGPGSGVAAIEGRFIDSLAGLASGAQFVIDQSIFPCTLPDVGGSWNTNASLAEYCVVWQRAVSATDHDIQARVIATDGTFTTATLAIAASPSTDDYAPAISKSRGDETLSGDYWNIAWVRDGNQDGRGRPFAARVYLTGAVTAEVEVMATELASNVDVSSTFDEVIPQTIERPFVIVFERQQSNGDIFAAVCTQSQTLSVQNLSELEDFDRSLTTRNPSVATEGVSLFVAFDELHWAAGPGSTDYDTYAFTGGLARFDNGARIALAERHQRLAYFAGTQQGCTVTSRWDGGGATDDAAIVWEERVGGTNGGGSVMAMLYDSASNVGWATHAVGVQYCEANAHGDSGDGGRRSSFIWVLGTGSITSPHSLRCVEMKQNAYAYFIVSQDTGNLNLAGGGYGRLCLGGAIGRVVGGWLLQSGSTGSVSCAFDPQVLPTPNGLFAASPGQTLYFQCWHRDAQNGVAGSNFSNACAITFTP